MPAPTLYASELATTLPAARGVATERGDGSARAAARGAACPREPASLPLPREAGSAQDLPASPLSRAARILSSDRPTAGAAGVERSLEGSSIFVSGATSQSVELGRLNPPSAAVSPPAHGGYGWLGALPVADADAEHSRDEREDEREDERARAQHEVSREGDARCAARREIIRLVDERTPLPAARRPSHDWLGDAAAAARRLERSRAAAAVLEQGEAMATQIAAQGAARPALSDDMAAARAAALDERLSQLLSRRAAHAQGDEHVDADGAAGDQAMEDEIEQLLSETDDVLSRSLTVSNGHARATPGHVRTAPHEPSAVHAAR